MEDAIKGYLLGSNGKGGLIDKIVWADYNSRAIKGSVISQVNYVKGSIFRDGQLEDDWNDNIDLVVAGLIHFVF